MSIVFYEAPMSSATPVARALAELNVPHERVRVELAAGAQRRPDFLALNPNGKVPTLVVDGTPMFEALAIMLWLAERYGVAAGSWPALDDPCRPQALSWSVWSYVTYGSAVHRLLLATEGGEAPQSELHAKMCHDELQDLLAILDRRLKATPFLLGDRFSLTDLIAASVVGWGTMVGVPLAAHARVEDWLHRCQSRPSWRSGTH